MILSAGSAGVCSTGGGLLRGIPVKKHGNASLLKLSAINRFHYKLAHSHLDGFSRLVDMLSLPTITGKVGKRAARSFRTAAPLKNGM